MERILPLLRVGMKSNTHTWNDFGLKQRVNLELGPSVASVSVGVSLLPPGLMSLSRQAGHPNSASQQLMDYIQKTRVVLEQVRPASEADAAALTREWAIDQRAEWLVSWVGRSTITTCLKKQDSNLPRCRRFTARCIFRSSGSLDREAAGLVDTWYQHHWSFRDSIQEGS